MALEVEQTHLLFRKPNSKQAQTTQNSFNHPNNTQITRKFKFKIYCRSLSARVMKKVLLLLRRRLVHSCLPTVATLLLAARRSEIKEKTKSGSRMQRVKIKGKRQCLMEKGFVSSEFPSFSQQRAALSTKSFGNQLEKSANRRVIKKSQLNGNHFYASNSLSAATECQLAVFSCSSHKEHVKSHNWKPIKALRLQ